MENLDKIFKAYDIRGRYPNEVNEEIGYKIGWAVAKFLKAPDLIVGRDSRASSENLAKVVIEGMRDRGVNVIDIDMVTTPMFYFSAVKWKLKGGVMTTASHNPPEYNGFKLIGDKAMPIGENSGLNKIKNLIKKSKFKTKDRRGGIEKRNALENYINHIIDFAHINDIKPLKIAVDVTRSTAEMVVPELFKYLPLKIVSKNADLGVTFDGDGDRIVFFDEKGNKVHPDLIGALLVHYYFKHAGKILCTEVSSRNLKEEIEEANNILVVSKVGHTFMKEKMEKQDIVFGCEPSGHYYLEANYNIESPFIALLKVLEILSRTKMPLSELIRPFQNYFREEIKIKKTTRSKVKEKTKEFSDWWYNIRASNTEPVIRLTIEARTKELLEQKKKEITSGPFFS